MAFLPPSSDDRPAATSSVTDWKTFFHGKQPVDPQTVRTLVLDLHQAGKYEDVISLIEQAIVSGQIQPWMYEVLALTMEAVGRPRAQVERVLLSSRDLVADDSDSILYLAAYLSRFERHEQALKLYRQVSVLDPLRVESYVMGLGIAEKLRDPAAVAWAAPGVLLRAWGKNRADLHRRAEELARQTASELRDADRPLEAGALEQLIASAKLRDLHVTLDWNGNGNLDLEVTDPTGAVCTALEPATAGGVLHVQSGQGPRQEECFEEAVAPVALSGEYRIAVNHVGGEIVGKRARLTIIRHEGSPRETRQTHVVPLGSPAPTVRVLLKEGRLPAPLVAPTAPVTATERPKRVGASVQQLPARNPRLAVRSPDGAVIANVGFQPIVQFIPSGVQLSALALVSADRRYVRISTSPQFTSVTDVFTFSFTGATGPGAGGGNF